MTTPTDTLQNSLAITATETVISNLSDDINMSCSDSSEIPPVLQLDSPLGCASSLNTSTTESLSLSISDTDSTPAMPVEPYTNKVIDIINSAGWDFNLENVSENVSTFSSPVSLCSVSHAPGITTTAAGKGRHRSWMLNYPALCFLVNGKY